MKQYPLDKIRNVGILAHSGAGKTSLSEAILNFSGVSERFGKVIEGTTVSDFDPEEIKRKISINTSVITFEYNDTKFNLLDTPGSFDFVGEIEQAVRVIDSAVIVVSGKSGVKYGTEKSWDYCEERKIPKLFFINKMDDEHSDYKKVVEQLREKFGKTVAPFQVPIVDDYKMQGFVDVISMRAKMFQDGPLLDQDIPENIMSEVEPIREMIIESVAETDENLMERYFNGDTFTNDEIKKALRKGVADGIIVPILCGSATTNKGVGVLIDGIIQYLASPIDVEKEITVNGDEVNPDENEPFLALIFKTVADPFVGKLSYFRVYSGSISADSTVYNANKNANEKIGKLYLTYGKKQISVPKISVGDIGAVSKLAISKTGDTLCKIGMDTKLSGINFPKPTLSMAILPVTKGDEEKISSGLNKLKDEDLTFTLENNKETHENIISGLGETHLDVIKNKLQTKFQVAVSLQEPKTAYRETIKKKVKVEGKHKKQSGGHGQFGHVWIEFEPGTTEKLEFCEKIFGGSVPKNFFPAVEKGLQESALHGVLAGYPMVNLKATLVDGSYHPVDSSEMAFKVAASLAFKAGIEQANPTLLEPIGKMEIIVPSEYTGDVMGDVNKRRGKVMGMEQIKKGIEKITAFVPMAEIHKYSTDLRKMTHSRGTFTTEFEKYEEVPEIVAAKIIEKSK